MMYFFPAAAQNTTDILIRRMIVPDYQETLKAIENIFHMDKNKDVVMRSFKTAAGRPAFIVYIDGMASSNDIHDFILRPLMRRDSDNITDVIEMGKLTENQSQDEAVSSVLTGDTAIYIDGRPGFFICETKGFAQRSVSTPETEVVIKGSQEGFNECVRTNITLIRKLIKSSDLITEFLQVGKLNKDTCGILYIEGLTNPELISEVKRRINGISADYVEGSGMLEQLMSGSKAALFPSILSTERPERAANYLSEGRVIVICDGTPFALVAPASITSMLDSTELNTLRWQSGTFIKIIRMCALTFCTLLPAAYIALTSFHREMLPEKLLSSIIQARENISFPTSISVVIMLLFFEIIREAGQRIPRSLGGAIGIVGGLILGQAAVEANFLSPVTLIVVALAGISNVAMPDYDISFTFRIIQFFLIFMSMLQGLLGITVGIVVVLTLMLNQKSFGRPILSVGSLRLTSGSSLFFSRPLWKQENRSHELKPKKPAAQPKKSMKWEERRP